ncbi:hypothetical protein V5F77_05380 [Xanthobacter sp. DSM 24535]|uniref:hypothetical protein n=1 Tax=Roseixanthobacter psychrophilus TaxID=3119917 RepID=UPI003728082B
MTDRDFHRAEEIIGRHIQQQAIMAEIHAQQTSAARLIALRIEILKNKERNRG